MIEPTDRSRHRHGTAVQRRPAVRDETLNTATSLRSTMSRYAPEAALVVGVLLALSLAGYGVLFAGVLPSLLAATLVLLAFAAFAAVRDDDPAAVLRPTPVLAGTALAALAVFGYGVLVARPLFGLLVGLVTVLPGALYHVRYGERVNPLSPRATLALAVIAAAGVLGYAVVVAGGDPLGSVDAALLLVAALDYRAQREGPVGGYAEMLAVGGTTAAGALLVLYFVAEGRPVTGLVVATPLLAVGLFVTMAA